MPVYEFSCKKCANTFEQLCPMDVDDAAVECPHCGATGAERLLSMFFSQMKDNRPSDCPMPAAGACSGSSCSCLRH